VLGKGRVASVVRRFGGDVLSALEAHRHEGRLRSLMQSGRVTMGAHSYGVPELFTFRGDATRLTIGRYVSIAAQVQILLGGNHRVDWLTAYPLRARLQLPGAHMDGHPASNGDIVIGNDVWLGFGCKILSGVEVGDGAVVGAFSVVTKSIRPYAIAVGQPARELRRRFSDEQVAALLRVAWWEWPDDEVRQEVSALCSANVDAFLSRHGGLP
jgi:acetyltransferase-like isoleucine patch superfamily enzyme